MVNIFLGENGLIFTDRKGRFIIRILFFITLLIHCVTVFVLFHSAASNYHICAHNLIMHTFFSCARAFCTIFLMSSSVVGKQIFKHSRAVLKISSLEQFSIVHVLVINMMDASDYCRLYMSFSGKNTLLRVNWFILHSCLIFHSVVFVVPWSLQKSVKIVRFVN